MQHKGKKKMETLEDHWKEWGERLFGTSQPSKRSVRATAERKNGQSGIPSKRSWSGMKKRHTVAAGMAWAILDNMPWDQSSKALSFPSRIPGSPREQDIKAAGSCQELELAHIARQGGTNLSNHPALPYPIYDVHGVGCLMQPACLKRIFSEALLRTAEWRHPSQWYTPTFSSHLTAQTTMWWKNYSWRSRSECFLRALWFSGGSLISWEALEDSWREDQGWHWLSMPYKAWDTVSPNSSSFITILLKPLHQ